MATEVSSSVLALCNCVKDGIVDLISFVMEVQMVQHCDGTQKQSSWIRQILHKFNSNKYN